jgi:hypothetical protein
MICVGGLIAIALRLLFPRRVVTGPGISIIRTRNRTSREVLQCAYHGTILTVHKNAATGFRISHQSPRESN